MGKNVQSKRNELKSLLSEQRSKIASVIKDFVKCRQNSNVGTLDLSYDIDIVFLSKNESIIKGFKSTKTSLYYLITVNDKFKAANILQQNLGHIIYEIYGTKVYTHVNEIDFAGNIKENLNEIVQNFADSHTELRQIIETINNNIDNINILKNLKTLVKQYISTLVKIKELKGENNTKFGSSNNDFHETERIDYKFDKILDSDKVLEESTDFDADNDVTKYIDNKFNPDVIKNRVKLDILENYSTVFDNIKPGQKFIIEYNKLAPEHVVLVDDCTRFELTIGTLPNLINSLSEDYNMFEIIVVNNIVMYTFQKHYHEGK